MDTRQRILNIVRYVEKNGEIPEVQGEDSKIIDQLKGEGSIIRRDLVTSAIPANIYDRIPSIEDQVWGVDTVIIEKKYGIKKSDLW